ncbi:hypothetical protein FOL47_000818 [Perkinsus chesapeaki]|uniref:Uncharacterized protein n=1 Tax=Perkinsus chesapeaki TaxID=330153 RepID=A0A7J6MLC6_PERCH|nr:hypothetical protein FOL47_000818 [Perkinsus chesapeaki]
MVSKVTRCIVLEPTSWSHAELEPPLSTSKWSMERYKTVVPLFTCVSDLAVHGRVQPLPKLIITLSTIQRLRYLQLIGVTASPLYNILSPSTTNAIPFLESLTIGFRGDEDLTYPTGARQGNTIHSRLKRVSFIDIDFGPSIVGYDTFSSDNGIALWLIHFLASCPVLEELKVLQAPARRRIDKVNVDIEASREIILGKGMPTWNNGGHLKKLHLGLWSERVTQGLVHRVSVAGSLEGIEILSMGVLSSITMKMLLDRGLGGHLEQVMSQRWMPSIPGPDGDTSMNRLLESSRHTLKGLSLECKGSCPVPWDIIIEYIIRYRPPLLRKVYLTLIMDDSNGDMVAPVHSALWSAALRCHYPNIPYFRRTTYTVIMDDICKTNVLRRTLGLLYPVTSARELFEEEQVLCVKPYDHPDRRANLDDDNEFLELWDNLPIEYQGQYWNIYNSIFGIFSYNNRGSPSTITPTPRPRRSRYRSIISPTRHTTTMPLDPRHRRGGDDAIGAETTTPAAGGVSSRSVDTIDDDDDGSSSVSSDASNSLLDILTIEELLKEDITLGTAASTGVVAYSGG